MDGRFVRVIELNGVTADLFAETLRDSSGIEIGLRPQSFAVLKLLVENANRLVSKEEIMRSVWPGIAVTNDSLVQCIHDIRRVLKDDAQAIIKTVPRRGYKLLLSVNSKPAQNGWTAAKLALLFLALLSGALIFCRFVVCKYWGMWLI